MSDDKPGTVVTLNRLKQLLDYDNVTGLFYWKKWVAGNAFSGTQAGSKNTMGHIKIQIDSRNYQAHRLAWLYEHGRWPEGEIDHINGDRTDNRIVNLRDVTTELNMQNKRTAYKNNKLSVMGVYRKGNKYAAKIQTNGKSVHLGVFETMNEAHKRYIEEKRKVHPGSTI